MRQFITHNFEDADGFEVEIRFPAKFIVCYGCRGTGSHVNPNIDSHGISPEEFDRDPDFKEAYFGGVYDVRCYDCKGERVLLAIDEEATQLAGLAKEMNAYYAYQQQVAQEEADDRHTRKMENGGFE